MIMGDRKEDYDSASVYDQEPLDTFDLEQLLNSGKLETISQTKENVFKGPSSSYGEKKRKQE